MAPCLCAPTNHAGSFRCRLHRSSEKSWGGRPLASSSSTAKGPHGAETSSKAVDNRGGKRMVPFARSNRVSASKSSEAKLRTELNRALIASKKEEILPSVEELRISASDELVPKKAFKIVAKSTTVVPVAGTITLRIVQEDQENAAVTDLASAKLQKESTLHPHHKVLKKRTSKERRLRAKSGTFLDATFK